MKQYSLKFVNEGKSFDMPIWTVAKHEELLNDMIPFDEKLKLGLLKKKEYDRIYNVLLILSSLHEIDKNVSEKDINLMHPDDFMLLLYSVYNSGKRGIEVNPQDFQEGEKKSPKN